MAITIPLELAESNVMLYYYLSSASAGILVISHKKLIAHKGMYPWRRVWDVLLNFVYIREGVGGLFSHQLEACIGVYWNENIKSNVNSNDRCACFPMPK